MREQQTAPAKAKREYRARPSGAFSVTAGANTAGEEAIATVTDAHDASDEELEKKVSGVVGARRVGDLER